MDRLTDGQVLTLANRLAELNVLMLRTLHAELVELGLAPDAMERESARVIVSAQRIIENSAFKFVRTEGSA